MEEKLTIGGRYVRKGRYTIYGEKTKPIRCPESLVEECRTWIISKMAERGLKGGRPERDKGENTWPAQVARGEGNG